MPKTQGVTHSGAPRSPTIPPALQDIALLDAPTCAAVGGMSRKWWEQEVREGRAPQPVVRRVRYTRWAAADVRAFWLKFIEAARQASDAGEQIKARAKRGGETAQANRRAKAVAAQPLPVHAIPPALPAWAQGAGQAGA